MGGEGRWRWRWRWIWSGSRGGFCRRRGEEGGDAWPFVWPPNSEGPFLGLPALGPVKRDRDAFGGMARVGTVLEYF